MGKTLVLICFLTILGGCSTGSQSSEPLTFSLNNLFWAVETNLSMGIQGYSENRREITSRPFIVPQNPALKSKGLHERGRAKVTILGDQRPYTIETQVTIERSKGGGSDEYVVNRYDKGLASKLLKNILASLKKSDRDKNVIDDFRSF